MDDLNSVLNQKQVAVTEIQQDVQDVHCFIVSLKCQIIYKLHMDYLNTCWISSLSGDSQTSSYLSV